MHELCGCAVLLCLSLTCPRDVVPWGLSNAVQASAVLHAEDPREGVSLRAREGGRGSSETKPRRVCARGAWRFGRQRALVERMFAGHSWASRGTVEKKKNENTEIDPPETRFRRAQNEIRNFHLHSKFTATSMDTYTAAGMLLQLCPCLSLTPYPSMPLAPSPILRVPNNREMTSTVGPADSENLEVAQEGRVGDRLPSSDLSRRRSPR